MPAMNRSLLLLTSLLLLGGCQSAPPPAPAEPATPASTATPAEKPAAFRRDTLYDLLVAELAGQRDRFDIALENYVHQARETRDPGVAERAFRVAEYLGDDGAALETALIWVDAAPESLDARRTAAIQLARAGRHDEAMVHMERVLHDNGNTSFDFLALTAAQLDPEARAGLRESFERLLERYPDNGQLILGRALLLLQDHDLEPALASLEKHPAGSREVAPILLRVQLLEKLGRSSEILPVLARAVATHPEERRLRIAYARQLVENSQFEPAQQQFEQLLKRSPEDDDLRLSLALVSIEAGALDEAAVHLQTLLAREAHVDAAHLNLGRIAERQNDLRSAETSYRQVQPGNSYLTAQMQLTGLLVKSGRVEEAFALLQDARSEQPDYALQLYLLQMERLSDLKRHDEAWALGSEALAQFPGDLNLHYSLAMLAEKRGDLAAMEDNLQLILEREPDNSMALNALGYTLADRTTRYAEALALIERAHALDGEDPAILDSLGWVHYRLGNLEQAEQYLRQSLQRLQDAEIAAHLGEVLWVRGQRSEATRIWRQAFEQSPDNRVLLETLRRLTGKETP